MARWCHGARVPEDEGVPEPTKAMDSCREGQAGCLREQLCMQEVEFLNAASQTTACAVCGTLKLSMCSSGTQAARQRTEAREGLPAGREPSCGTERSRGANPK